MRKLNITILGNREGGLAATGNRKNRKITKNKTEYFRITISLPFSKDIKAETNITYKYRQDYRDLYDRNTINDFLQ